MNETGRGVRVAIIDSGVNPAHPHVGGIAGGVGISCGGKTPVYLDYLGHGTAAAGAIREKAPDALLYAVKVFDRALSTNVETIVRALEWCLDHGMHVVNLSLGTANASHAARFEPLLHRFEQAGVALVSAWEEDGRPLLPGRLPGVFSVGLDWECPRDVYRANPDGAGPLFFASGYPRSIPGVPHERNLHGISFAVANMSGFVARARESCDSLATLRNLLVEERHEPQRC